MFKIFTKTINRKYNIGFYYLLIFFTFFTYSFYAIISKYNNILFTLISVLLFIIFHFKYINKDDLNIPVNFNEKDIFLFLFLFSFSIIFNFKDLNYSLHADEFAFAVRTQRTAIYFLYELFLNYKFVNIENLQFRYFIHLIGFFELIFLIIISKLILRKKFNIIILLILITLVFRLFLKDLGMHPPINHLSSFILSSIFGFSDIIFRISYLLLYILSYIFLFKQLNIFNDYKVNFYKIIFFFTLPLGILSSTNVDHSMWGHIFLLNFLVYYHFNNNLDYKKLVLLISLFSMARITNFILIVPLFFDYIFNNKKKFKIFEFFNTFFPVLFFLPFVLKTIVSGSHVHDQSGGNLLIETLNQIINFKILDSTIVFNPIYIFILSSLGLFYFLTRGSNFKKLNILFLLILYFIIFSSISKSWLGAPKYVFEFSLPFLIFFSIIFLNNVNKYKKILLIILTVTNLLLLSSFDKKEFISDANKNNYFVRDRFDYKSAFEEVLKDKKNNSNIFLGVNYGFVIQILNNYSIKDTIEVRKNNLKVKKYLKKNKDNNIYQVVNELDFIESVIIDKRIYKDHSEYFKNWNLINSFSYPERKENYILFLTK